MNIYGFIDWLDERQRRIENYPRFLADWIYENRDLIKSLVRDQMLRGRDGDGNVLTPGYLQDPFFRDIADAIWYKSRKDKMASYHDSLIVNDVPFPDKNDNTPNLIWGYEGPFQESMYIMFNSVAFRIGSRYDETADIEQKYNNNIFKLAPLSKEYIWTLYLLAASRKYLGF